MGREDQFVGSLVDPAGDADAHPVDKAPTERGLHGIGHFGDGGDGCARARLGCGVGGELDGFAAQDLAIDIDDAEVGFGGAQVDGQRNVGVVEGDEGGAAAARQMAQRSRRDPALLDQLPDDERNGAGLQAGEAGEVGTADGLAQVNGMQNDVPVDGARGLAGGNSAIGPGWLGVHVGLVPAVTDWPEWLRVNAFSSVRAAGKM